MPKYLIKRDTYISHEGRMVKAGEKVTIEWPEGCKPRVFGDNMEPIDDAEKPRTFVKGAKEEQLA